MAGLLTATEMNVWGSHRTSGAVPPSRGALGASASQRTAPRRAGRGEDERVGGDVQRLRVAQDGDDLARGRGRARAGPSGASRHPHAGVGWDHPEKIAPPVAV